eukprot:SAG11_NODE_2561_length_3220_cov_1.882730_2_plen_309_part_00
MLLQFFKKIQHEHYGQLLTVADEVVANLDVQEITEVADVLEGSTCTLCIEDLRELGLVTIAQRRDFIKALKTDSASTPAAALASASQHSTRATMAMLKRELQEMCIARGLSHLGNKQPLVDRINADIDAIEARAQQAAQSNGGRSVASESADSIRAKLKAYTMANEGSPLAKLAYSGLLQNCQLQKLKTFEDLVASNVLEDDLRELGCRQIGYRKRLLAALDKGAEIAAANAKASEADVEQLIVRLNAALGYDPETRVSRAAQTEKIAKALVQMTTDLKLSCLSSLRLVPEYAVLDFWMDNVLQDPEA